MTDAYRHAPVALNPIPFTLYHFFKAFTEGHVPSADCLFFQPATRNPQPVTRTP